MTAIWTALTNRAVNLASQGGPCAELLGFYARLLGVQAKIDSSFRSGERPSGVLTADLRIMRPAFGGFFEVVAQHGPAALADQARTFAKAPDAEVDELLFEYWVSPADTQFFAKALVQPYAHFLAEVGLKPAGRKLWDASNKCPFCGGKPQLAVLRTRDGDDQSGSRSLLCATCLTEWSFPRVVCPDCGEERPEMLGYFHTAEYDYVRSEFCERCKQYIKTIDLTKLGLACPLVDEVATAPLDLWCTEHGYSKLELNIVGL